MIVHVSIMKTKLTCNNALLVVITISIFSDIIVERKDEFYMLVVFIGPSVIHFQL